MVKREKEPPVPRWRRLEHPGMRPILRMETVPLTGRQGYVRLVFSYVHAAVKPSLANRRRGNGGRPR